MLYLLFIIIIMLQVLDMHRSPETAAALVEALAAGGVSWPLRELNARSCSLGASGK